MKETPTRKRTGRPASRDELRPFSVYLGARHRQALEKLADQDGLTLSEALREIIDDYITNRS